MSTKSWIPVLAASALAAVVGIAALLSVSNGGGDVAAESGSVEPGIVITGTGLVRVRPDTAYVDLGVQATAATVAEAVAAAGSSMQAVIDSLKANGLTDEDIQTTSFSIQPQYDYNDGTAVLRGYLVTNAVNARIKGDAATVGGAAGKVIDDAVAAGRDRLIVQGIRFDIADQSDVLSRARRAAVEDAEAKARELAEYAGVSLGKALQISESVSTPGPVYRDGSAAPDEETPIQAGLLNIAVNVSITYAIE